MASNLNPQRSGKGSSGKASSRARIAQEPPSGGSGVKSGRDGLGRFSGG